MEAVYICSIDTETRRNNLRCLFHTFEVEGNPNSKYLLLLTLNIVAGLIIGHGEQEQFLLELQTFAKIVISQTQRTGEHLYQNFLLVES